MPEYRVRLHSLPWRVNRDKMNADIQQFQDALNAEAAEGWRLVTAQRVGDQRSPGLDFIVFSERDS